MSQPATVDPASLAVSLRLLRATVVEPWESLDQVLTEHGLSDLGNPLTEGTAAWHLRHLVEIFRLHARTTLAGLADPSAAAVIAPPEGPIPLTGSWSPQTARDELLADIDRFSACLLRLPPDALDRTFTYGRSTDLTTMLSTILQHITWHSAAIHYWCRWRR
jgi:hypothetical protein